MNPARRVVWGIAAAAMILAAGAAARAAEPALSGRVYAPDGKPAAGAEVRLYYVHDSLGYGLQRLAAVTADERGEFRVAVPAFEPPAVAYAPVVGRLYLVGLAPGATAGIAEEAPDRADGYSLSLSAAHEVVCKVRAAAGPAAGARVEAFPWLSRGRTHYPATVSANGNAAVNALCREIYCVTTDAEGNARFPALPVLPFLVAATHADGGVGFARVEPDVHAVTSSLTATARPVRGRVVDADTGKPLAGILVSPPPPSTWMYQGLRPAVSDDQGRFVIDAGNFASLFMRRGGAGQFIIAVDPRREPLYAPGWAPRAADAAADAEVTIALSTGKRVAGRVINAADKPLADAGIDINLGREFVGYGHLGRVCDAEGRFALRLAGGVEIGVLTTPPAVQLAHGPAWQAVNADAGAGLVLQVDTVPLTTVDVEVKKPDGAPAAGAMIAAPNRNLQAGYAHAVCDPAGRGRLLGLAAGTPTLLHATMPEGQLAAVATVTAAAGQRDPLVVTLADAPEVQISMHDGAGRPVGGQIMVLLTGDNGRVRLQLAAERTGRGADEGVARIDGLPPGVEYLVYALAANHRLAGAADGRSRRWRAPAGEARPKLDLVMEQQPRPGFGRRQPSDGPPQRDAATFRDEVAAVRKEAGAEKADAVDKNLTWFVVADGIVLADAGRNEAKRFEHLLGTDKLLVAGFAFGKEKVWVGTDQGLFTWDREDRYWARFAVNATLLEPPVTAVAVTADGKLRVTIQEKGRAPRTFLYDPAETAWREEAE